MPDRATPNVLVVTAEADTARVILACLAARGVRGTLIAELPSARERLQRHSWNLIALDLQGWEEIALAFVRQTRQDAPELPILAVGPQQPLRLAVEAMRRGCDDYLPKPLEAGAVEQAVDLLVPNHDVAMAACPQEDGHGLFYLAGSSPALMETIRLADKIAPTGVPVLITGESGTGKELVSCLIHRRSRRSQGPYIRVNCAALSESLLESELFGHERGAFTGAYAQRKGRFERAHGGTLLLDEISETTPRLQAELLRVLEQQDFERVGGTQSIRVNVRVLSTSNRDLAADVRAGRFRQDLYYRLAGIHMTVPPLRDRPEDIAPLVWHFVNMYAGETRRQVRELDGRLVEVFRDYSWPGNVRQLRSVVRQVLILGQGPVLSLSAAPALEREMTAPAPASPSAAATLRLNELERQAVFEALRQTQRNQVKAARLLGITDRTLREKLRRYRQEAQPTRECGGLDAAFIGMQPQAAPGEQAPQTPRSKVPALFQGGTA
jgi:DNA-binding NtrC family response regulator